MERRRGRRKDFTVTYIRRNKTIHRITYHLINELKYRQKGSFTIRELCSCYTIRSDLRGIQKYGPCSTSEVLTTTYLFIHLRRILREVGRIITIVCQRGTTCETVKCKDSRKVKTSRVDPKEVI